MWGLAGRGENAQEHVGLKKAGFYGEESGRPRIVDLLGKHRGEQSNTYLFDENGLKCFRLVGLPYRCDSLGEKRVTKADGEQGERILGRAGK
jgi:hypothetical protein